MLAHAPEPIRLMLSVDDPERVQRLLDDGATWQVRLEKGSDVEVIASTATPIADSFVANSEAADHDFVVEFTPEVDDGPQRVAVTIELVSGAEDDAEVHTWGKGALSYRGDASALAFEGREAYAIEGVGAADRTWGEDLDGDGIGDLIVSSLEEDANGNLVSALHVFKCGPEKCEPAGVVQTPASSGDQIVAPDAIVAPDTIADDQPQGFLAAAVSQRSAEGDISSVEAIWIELVADGDAHKVRETRAPIDLAGAVGEARLHEQTLAPRLLLDRESGLYRPGVIVTRTTEQRGLLGWSTLVVDANGVMSDFNGQRIFEGLNEEQTQVALGGQLAVCLPNDTKTLLPQNAPEAMLLSAFELDGNPTIGVSYLPAIGGPVQTFFVEEYDLDELFGEQSGGQSGEQDGGGYGSVGCKLGDLDADGFDDLVITVADADAFARLGAHRGQPAALLLSRGIDKKDIRRTMATPELIVKGISADSKGFMKGNELTLHAYAAAASISKRSARTGRNPQTSTKMAINGDGKTELAGEEFVLAPPGLPIFSFDRIDRPEVLAQGNDRVVRKKPGRTTYANVTLKGPLAGSTQLAAAGGSWVLARVSPSIAANDAVEEGAPLKTTDPKAILGWLGTTGPFLPVEPSSGDTDFDFDELSDVLYMSGADDQTTPLLYQGLREEQGGLTSVLTAELAVEEGRAMLRGERTFDLDTSQVDLEGKKVVKFKAGAELSKAVNIAAPDDDTDTDCDDTNACPSPADVLLAFELDTGEILTAVLDYDGDNAPVIQGSALRSTMLANLGLREESDLSGLRTSLRMGHDGQEPIVILHGVLLRGENADEADETFVMINRRGEIQSRESLREAATQPVSLFGDVLGGGTDQVVVCKPEADADAAQSAIHCSVTRPSGDSPQWSAPILAKGDVVCVADVDGDRCADLVTDAGEYVSSRCNGEFEPAAVELGQWAAHLVCGGEGSGPTKAQDYNSVRSNKPGSIAWDDASDDDNPLIGLPFFDGIALPKWP
jgi:nucleoid DNA-binding protein